MNRCLAVLFPALLLAAAGLSASCASPHACRPIPAHIEGPTLSDRVPKDLPGLHNVVAYHANYWSGGAPEGDAGFDSLAGMGVRTVISVDGAIPEVNRAAARGIRYIHLPIGYNGFDETRRLELARATRDALRDGPVYIHCHHGKHRSAGAAGTVVASLGWASNDDMVARMKVSGTAPGYKGLYACTANAGVIDPAVLDALPAHFPSASRPVGFVKVMVELDETMERLKAVEKAGWTAPENHPDLVPAALAGQVADLLRHCAAGDRAGSKPHDFAARLRRNSDQAQALEDALAAGSNDPLAMSAQFKTIADTCKACHAVYRD